MVWTSGHGRVATAESQGICETAPPRSQCAARRQNAGNFNLWHGDQGEYTVWDTAPGSRRRSDDSSLRKSHPRDSCHCFRKYIFRGFLQLDRSVKKNRSFLLVCRKITPFWASTYLKNNNRAQDTLNYYLDLFETYLQVDSPKFPSVPVDPLAEV